ncbi:BP74-related protein [Streptomyces flaveolus]|uniref:BP74-related protein n=1 Tax=Streptomyces flaveolus TaxID=67297 RepID=UPI0036FA0CA1
MATAYFAFQCPPGQGKEFIFETSDDAIIAHARRVLSGEEKDKTHVMGRIKTTRKDYNPDFDFHLDPATIQFFDVMIEVCDAEPQYVDDHLDEAGGAFLPGYHWCPWASALTREVKR